MSVVIVVPAFAEGDGGDPPIVARIVTGVEAAAAPHVRGGINEPGGMQTEHDADEGAPEDQRDGADAGHAANGEQDRSGDDERHPVVIVQPQIELFLGKIWRVFAHARRVGVVCFAEQEPADVCPPGTIPRRVRIAFLI